MKAVRIHKFGGPEVLKYEDVPDAVCNRNEVMIEIKASSLNHLDLWVRTGLPIVPLPIILGSDASGVVIEIGEGVSEWIVGDEVIVQPGVYCGECRFCKSGKENYCSTFGIFGETQDGMQTERVSIDPKYLEKKPEQISFEEAAAFPLVFLTAYTMLVRRAKIKNGETVLVLGSTSGVGSAAVQLAKVFGCKVIATAGDEKKLEFVQNLGADYTIDHNREVISDRVKNITESRGVDVVFEHVGTATWQESLRSLSKGGRLVTCGATTGSDVTVNLRHLFMKQHTIHGSTMGDAQGFKEVVSLLRKGKVSPVLDRMFGMREAAKAHRYLEDRKQYGKIVLYPDW